MTHTLSLSVLRTQPVMWFSTARRRVKSLLFLLAENNTRYIIHFFHKKNQITRGVTMINLEEGDMCGLTGNKRLQQDDVSEIRA
jgi:hypothetical protein